MSAMRLEEVLARADVLPALPQVVRHILDSLKDERANAELLAERIGSDPAIVARLLAAANASAYGLVGHVDSVRQAVLLLGIEKVKAITLATAIVDRYKAAPPFDAQRLWLHSLGVAVCAREIALHAGLDAETAFTAGLLHDIGQLLLFAVDPVAYGKTLGRKDELDICTVDAEHSCLGLDHAEVGAALARHWSLPEPIVLAIAGHHAPDQLPDHELADVIHVAEVLSHGLDLGGGPDNRVPELSEMACARLGIEWHEFATHFPEIDARFDCICLMLGL